MESSDALDLTVIKGPDENVYSEWMEHPSEYHVRLTTKYGTSWHGPFTWGMMIESLMPKDTIEEWINSLWEEPDFTDSFERADIFYPVCAKSAEDGSTVPFGLLYVTSIVKS